MKRFFTLDWLRGIAIIAMVGFHTIEILAGDSNLLNFIFNQPLLVQILLSPFLILMSWRSFFLIISTIGLTYSLQKRYEKIDNERIDNSSKLKLNFKVMLQHCLVGFILFLHALLYQIFWNPYSTIAQGRIQEYWIYLLIYTIIYFSDAIGNIALSVIIVSIVCFILMSYKGFIKQKRNILIFGLIGIAGLFSNSCS
jgi:peptidoglycan/LPS O-acetylase OafA/YrhL